MPAALGHALGEQCSVSRETHGTDLCCPNGAQQVSIAPLERRARDDETNPRALSIAQSGANREQPTAAVVVRQRDPGRHALHVVGGMQVVTFDELDVERASELRSERALAGARDAHHHVEPSVDSAHEVAPILYHRRIRGYSAMRRDRLITSMERQQCNWR